TATLTLPDIIQGVYRAELTTHAQLLGAPIIYEPNQSNNTLVNNQSVVISQIPFPDLQVSIASAPSIIGASTTAAISFTVVNQGTVRTQTPHWVDKVFLSLNSTLSPDDRLVATADNGSALAAHGEPGDSYKTDSVLFVIPKEYQGPAFLIVVA